MHRAWLRRWRVVRRRPESRRPVEAPPPWWNGSSAASTPVQVPPAAAYPPPPDPEQYRAAVRETRADEVTPPPPPAPRAPAWLPAPGAAYGDSAEPQLFTNPAPSDTDSAAGPPVTPIPTGEWVAEHGDGDSAPPSIWVPRSAAPPASSRQIAVAEPPVSRAAPAPAVRPADSRSSAAVPRVNVERSLAAVRPVDPGEAAQLAITFSLDYLSWDEDRPTRRSEVLRMYLPEGADTTLGWSGRGRQRAEFACAGLMESDGFCLWIDVRVRVTPYEPLRATAPAGDEGPRPDFPLPEGAIWSSAPAPDAPGWGAGPAVWMRLTVPVRRHDSGRLVVDLSPIPDPHAPTERQEQ